MAQSQWSQFIKSVWAKRLGALAVLVLVFLGGAWFSSGGGDYEYYDEYGYDDYDYAETEEAVYNVKSLSYAPESAYYGDNISGLTTATDSSYGRNGSDDYTDESFDIEQRVIKTGSVSIQVKSTDDTINSITSISSAYGGFVQSSETWLQSDETTSGYITFKVDAENFEQAVEEIKALATIIDSESISGQDVTEEFVDLQSRLGNLEAEEAQYLQIMERAFTVEDLLLTSDYLSAVREDIEVIEGRLNYLSSRTDFSTISVSIYEEASIIAPTSDWQPVVVMKEAINTLVESLQGVAEGVIELVIIGGPYLLFAWLIFVIGRKIMSRKKRGRK